MLLSAYCKHLAWACGLLSLLGLGCASGQNDQAQPTPEVEYTSPMTGLRFVDWDNGRCRSKAQIGTVRLVPRRWGPFTLIDIKDIILEDVCLQLESDSVLRSFEELENSLTQLLCLPGQEVTSEHTKATEMSQGSAGNPLVILPPRVSARLFSCTIFHPEGEWVSLESEDLKFAGEEKCLALEGQIWVRNSSGQALRCEVASWWPAEGKIFIPGDYDLHSGPKILSGQKGLFSLSGIELKKLKMAQKYIPQERLSSPSIVNNPLIFFLGNRKMPNNGLDVMSCLFFNMIPPAEEDSQGSRMISSRNQNPKN